MIMGSSDWQVALLGSGRGYIITVFSSSVIRCAASNDHSRRCRKHSAALIHRSTLGSHPVGKAGTGGIRTSGRCRSLVSAAFRHQPQEFVASVAPASIRIARTPFDVWAVLFSAIPASGSL
jgi:hypothetical protein